MALSRSKTYQRLLQGRKSRRAFSTKVVPRQLWRGFLDDATKPLFQQGVRLPAAGGFSEYEVILLSHRLAGVKRGTYRIHPAKGGAVRLKKIPLDLELLQERVCWAYQGTAAQATLIIVACGTAYREKYGKRGLGLLYQNLGVVQFHFYLTATAWGLGGCAIGWMEECLFEKLFPLGRGDAVVAFTFGLGSKK